MPKVLEAGLLYVSEEFEVAGHLCACGCGNKVITPLGPTEWSFTEEDGEPTLSPSIGSWQLPCQSHYWITAGRVMWASKWTQEQIERGRKAEEEALREYYGARMIKKPGRLSALWRRLKEIARSTLRRR
jgi:hypothetical protein